jgi:hypothetical protein
MAEILKPTAQHEFFMLDGPGWRHQSEEIVKRIDNFKNDGNS